MRKTKHIYFDCMFTFFPIYYIFDGHTPKFCIFITNLIYALNICLMPRCWLCTVSLCIILMMEDGSELSSNWSQIGYLKNIFLGSLKSLRNGSVLGMNIWIPIYKWIRNDDSKFNINCEVEQTLRHSLIPLFLGHPVYIGKSTLS